MWDNISYSIPNINGDTVEMEVIIYPWRDLMPVSGVNSPVETFSSSKSTHCCVQGVISFSQGIRFRRVGYRQFCSFCASQGSASLTIFSLHMLTSSHGKAFRATGPLGGESTGGFPHNAPVTWSFDISLILA